MEKLTPPIGAVYEERLFFLRRVLVIILDRDVRSTVVILTPSVDSSPPLKEFGSRTYFWLFVLTLERRNSDSNIGGNFLLTYRSPRRFGLAHISLGRSYWSWNPRWGLGQCSANLELLNNYGVAGGRQHENYIRVAARNWWFEKRSSG